jgi:hypothetical protein
VSAARTDTTAQSNQHTLLRKSEAATMSIKEIKGDEKKYENK